MRSCVSVDIFGFILFVIKIRIVELSGALKYFVSSFHLLLQLEFNLYELFCVKNITTVSNMSYKKLQFTDISSFLTVVLH